MPYCGRCGHEVPSEFRFCPHCGADLASPGGPAVGGGGPNPATGTSGGPGPGVGTATMTGTTTRNPATGPGGPGGPGGGPGPQTQLRSTAAPPSHRHRASIAPGLFLAAAGFLIVGFAYGALAYEAFTHVTLNLTRGSTIGFGAGFLVVGVGLVVLAVMRARD